MDRLRIAVEKSIASRQLLRDGQSILVAVSGGLDSMVLLRVLHALADAHQWRLTVAHFNHQLRGRASEADEKLVLQTSRALGWPATAGGADVASAARKAGVSTEMAGRTLRHDFLAQTARERCIPTIALAHHADDQVELFFLRLLRGTGLSGLAGMQWSNPSPSDSSITLIRPLLDQSKSALREAAKATRVRFREDATNKSVDILRNRVRQELVPLLLGGYQPRLSEHVLRLMDMAGAEAQVTTDQAEHWLSGKRRAKFAALPVAVQRRVIHLQLTRLGEAPDFGLVERLREGGVKPFSIGSGRFVSLDEAGRLHARKFQQPKFDESHLDVVMAAEKGKAEFDGLAVSWEVVRQRGAALVRKSNLEYFDAERIGGNICLRHWRPGDRFQPIGTSSACKLQDLFTNMKVPREERHRRVVAATGQGEVFWVEGLRIAEGFKLTTETVGRLQWKWRRKL